MAKSIMSPAREGPSPAAHKKCLFICGTPLQSLIIERIIELEKLSKESCSLFFYSYVRSAKYDRAFARLRPLFGEAQYYCCEKSYPGYVIDTRKLFSRMDYETIYFAAVTSSFVLLALSVGKPDEIVTFDDGTANIFPGSAYSSKFGLTLKKALALGIFGNRYTLQRIRSETRRHYTLYPGVPNNVSSRLIPISIILPPDSSASTGNCSLILGTVFKEFFPSTEPASVIAKLSRFVKSLGENVFYLPHPRSGQSFLDGCKTISSEKIAEEILCDLCREYASVNLYGFCSSAQFNVGHYGRVKNAIFSTEVSRLPVENMIENMTRAGISAFEVVDLDNF